MSATIDLSPVLKDETLYLCDNGACYCGEHAGAARRIARSLRRLLASGGKDGAQ